MKGVGDIDDILKMLPEKLQKWVKSWPDKMEEYAAVVALIASIKGVQDEKGLQEFFESDLEMQIVLMNMLYHSGGESKEFMEKSVMEKLQPEAAVLVKAPTEDILSIEVSKRIPQIRAMLEKESKDDPHN